MTTARQTTQIRTAAWFPGMLALPAYANPGGESGFTFNLASLLVVLGVWAIVMGVRNLRALRYKPLAPQRHASGKDPGDG